MSLVKKLSVAFLASLAMGGVGSALAQDAPMPVCAKDGHGRVTTTKTCYVDIGGGPEQARAIYRDGTLAEYQIGGTSPEDFEKAWEESHAPTAERADTMTIYRSGKKEVLSLKRDDGISIYRGADKEVVPAQPDDGITIYRGTQKEVVTPKTKDGITIYRGGKASPG